MGIAIQFRNNTIDSYNVKTGELITSEAIFVDGKRKAPTLFFPNGHLIADPAGGMNIQIVDNGNDVPHHRFDLFDIIYYSIVYNGVTIASLS
jgi:hypothetical protein